MAIRNWHLVIKTKLDSLDSQSFTRIEPEILDIFINDSINTLVRHKYDEFEKTQHISDNLNPIIPGPVSCTITKETTGYRVTLPTNYYYHLTSDAYVTEATVEYPIFLKRVELDDKTKALIDPFNKPNAKEAIMLFEGNSIFVHSIYPITKFMLTYLRKPQIVNWQTQNDSDFDGKNLEDEIINLTVSKMLEAYSSERIATQPKINV